MADLLKDEGYMLDSRRSEGDGKANARDQAEVFRRPPSDRAHRARQPFRACACTAARTTLPKVLGGLGISIMSTSAGLMTDAQARAKGLGGEVIGRVA